ncbi:MAG: SDR family NAD(P)-dependent oxidoreductase [Sphingomonadales bacterium]|nr:SDR family NAD(P)-dependent oxidoreductase [Sphingomonadales bacterium]MDE2168154.1 SDR family NAD(P)-dependent oxidoreductase [Sphingomonadales bacterium]
MQNGHEPVGQAVVFGAGGMGRALVAALAASGAYRKIHVGMRKPSVEWASPEWVSRIAPLPFDLLREETIAQAAGAIDGPVDLVLVTTGVLSDASLAVMPEKSIRAMDARAMAHVLAINTIGPALIAKHMLPLLRRDRRAVFAALSARVGSLGDNRLGGWHSYRASKAALNMVLVNLSIEMARTHPHAIIAGLHPGTVATDLSAPFQRGVAPDRLFLPERAASCLLRVLDGLTQQDSGGVFAWDGQRLPW